MANIAVQRIKRELKEVLNSDEVISTFQVQFLKMTLKSTSSRILYFYV